jgi:hypothetical protein
MTAFPVDRCLWCSRLIRAQYSPKAQALDIVACPAHLEDADALAKAFYSVKWRERSWRKEMALAEAEIIRAMGVPATYLGFNTPTGVTNPRFTELEVTRRYKGSAREQWAQQLKDGEAWVAPEDEWRFFP